MAVNNTTQPAVASIAEETLINSKKATALPAATITDINPYYTDTIAKAGEILPAVQPKGERKNIIDIEYEKLSFGIDAELQRDHVNFEKLLRMVHKTIAFMMRKAHKADHDYLHEVNIQLKEQSIKIKGTYNTWSSMTITAFSAAISIVGGGFGLSPMFPKLVAADTAAKLASSSQSITGASTGVSGIGSIFNNRSEADRFVEQQNLKRLQDKEDARKGAQHKNKETGSDTLKTHKEAERLHHDTKRSMLS